MIYSQGMSCLDYEAKRQKPDHAVLWCWLGSVYCQIPGRDYIMMHANIVMRKFMSLQNISTAVSLHVLLQTDINIEQNMDVWVVYVSFMIGQIPKDRDNNYRLNVR